MMYIVIVILIAMYLHDWDKQKSSQIHTDWLMKNDPDFRDMPGNRYYRDPKV